MTELEYFQFTPDLKICRIINGMWQVAGGHGPIDTSAALQNMLEYHEAGFTTWDLADHYGPSEDFIGQFRRLLASEKGAAELHNIQAFTKWVPRPAQMTRRVVEQAINTSLRRMDIAWIDLLQFHWWEYPDTAYLDALVFLMYLHAEYRIRHIGLTNFDTKHMERVVKHGIKIVSNQVQYSLIDRRPEVQMVDYCQQNNISLLAYGTLCGGLLSEKYLNQPDPYLPSHLNTASLRKYKEIIDLWGGWVLFQELLVVLKDIADKYGVSIPNVAVRYVLDKPAVAAVIVGARLGAADHRNENARAFGFSLDDDDLDRIHAVTNKSRDLYKLIGDCGDEYRR